MAGECANPVIGFGIQAPETVVTQFDFFTGKVNEYLNNANQFSQALAEFEINPVDIQPVNFDPEATFVPFESPPEPDAFSEPNALFGDTQPQKPNIAPINTTRLSALQAPNITAPKRPPISIPAPPTVNLPEIPGDAPVVGEVDIPTFEGDPLPEVPTLFELQLPDVPDISFDELQVERPTFIPPGALQDFYSQDLIDYRSTLWTDIGAELDATGVTDVHARLQAMLAGGTGLPANIEQALFDRVIGREDASSQQAVNQAEQEWAARGFSLPGSTLLARVQEVRQANRVERGRANRELAIQFHNQEIENLRFSVQQAIALEGQLLQAHTAIYDVARQLADGHWVVLKGIYDSHLDLFRLQLEIYQSDIAAFREKLQIELAKLEVFRSQLEGQRLVGTINQQLVDIYNTELQGVLANVEVFRARVQGAEAQIRAELGKVEVYKARLDGFATAIQGERAKVDIFSAQVGAEETKARLYAAQVDAFGRRIDAFRSEVDAEATKVNAEVGVAEAETRIYSEEVNAWRAGIEANTQNLLAFVEVHRANLQRYTSLLERERFRVEGESRNFELEIERERARVQADLRTVDQTIEQLKHTTELGLSAVEIASRVNSQLAASAMSAINVSAGMTASTRLSASDSRDCSTTFSGLVT